MSDLYKISSGVPQGSILGPLLFLIFINDFPNASAYFSVSLFADDTSLTASGNDLDNLINEINDIFNWQSQLKISFIYFLAKPIKNMNHRISYLKPQNFIFETFRLLRELLWIPIASQESSIYAQPINFSSFAYAYT